MENPAVDTSNGKQGDADKTNGFVPTFDFTRVGNGSEEFRVDLDQVVRKGNDTATSEELKSVLETSEKLKELIAKDIIFSQAVLTLGEKEIIFPRTINVIQGQPGVHKSRIAATECAAFLELVPGQNDLLGFRRCNSETAFTVLYVDTERNLSDQLPYALQTILLMAGYNIGDTPDNFKYISLLTVDRKLRFATLVEYLDLLRMTMKTPLFVVLDVSTDCIEDFNSTDQSLALIDHMNKAVNEHDVVFVCVIHENPNTVKARGHFGTELMNKASTVIQVGFMKDKQKNDTDIIKVQFLKCRNTSKHSPVYMKYSDESKRLVLADESEIQNANNQKKESGFSKVIHAIEVYLGAGAPLPRMDLLRLVMEATTLGERAVEVHLKEILVSQGVSILNQKGVQCRLIKEPKGKTVQYRLVPSAFLAMQVPAL